MALSTLTVEERILAASAKRDDLLTTIAATQSAATTLTQVKLDLASLNGKAWDLRATWHDIRDTAAREQEEYEDIRDSSVRKLFMGSDKYNELLSKEEGEHVQAQEWLDKARAAADAADALVEDTKKKRDKLEKQKEQHFEAEIALEELYNSVFEGPVPNNPEEDRLRAQLAEAQETFDSAVKRTCRAASVANKLWMANTSIRSAKLSAGYALRVSRGEMSGKPGKGTMQSKKTYSNFKADNLERQHLKNVQVALTRASALLAEVQEDDPEIKGLVVPEGLADGSSLAGTLDAWINTPATSLLFHAEIKETVKIVAEIEPIDDKVSAWEAKVEKLSVERNTAGEALKLAREKLQQLRAQIFEQILREGSGATPAYEEPLSAGEAPPPYS